MYSRTTRCYLGIIRGGKLNFKTYSAVGYSLVNEVRRIV